MSPLWLILALACAVGGVFLFNTLPDRWFCDYGESPAEEKRRRLPLLPGILCFAALMAGTWLAAGHYLAGAASPLLLLLVWVCLLISAGDILYHILPDQFVIALALVGVAFLLMDLKNAHLYLLGGLVGGGILFVVGLLGKWIFKAEAMGFGDVKLAGALGLLCGLPGILYAMAITLVTAALVALPVMIFSRKKRPYLPFAPFLCLGGIAALIFNEPIHRFMLWYISLFS